MKQVLTIFLVSLSTNFMTLIPSLTLTDYEWFPWSICNGYGMPAGNAYHSRHLVPSPIAGLACAPTVGTRFLELAMSLLDFSPQKPLGTFRFCFILFQREGTHTGGLSQIADSGRQQSFPMAMMCN